MADKRIFNLLKPVTPPPSAWDKIYEWILGKARIVVLITEIIIAVAFVFKVIEDTTAKNKDKQIDQLNSELTLYSQQLEPEFRQIQNKAGDYIVLWDSSSEYNNVINEVFSYIENPSSDVSVRAGKGTISITGFDDLSQLQKLEDSMKNSKTFSSVDIRDLTLEGEEVTANKGRYLLQATINSYTRSPIEDVQPTQ